MVEEALMHTNFYIGKSKADMGLVQMNVGKEECSKEKKAFLRIQDPTSKTNTRLIIIQENRRSDASKMKTFQGSQTKGRGGENRGWKRVGA